jgi:hypothetical protein
MSDVRSVAKRVSVEKQISRHRARRHAPNERDLERAVARKPWMPQMPTGASLHADFGCRGNIAGCEGEARNDIETDRVVVEPNSAPLLVPHRQTWLEPNLIAPVAGTIERRRGVVRNRLRELPERRSAGHAECECELVGAGTLVVIVPSG